MKKIWHLIMSVLILGSISCHAADEVRSQYDESPSGEWRRTISVKTNAVGWILANANVAGEIDLCPHWSFNIPIYYSALNYFTYKWKFRNFSLQPEVRYWFDNDNDGWYVGAHFGMAYFNMAFGGKERYQDAGRRSPALGGGIAGGYRLPLSKDERWKLEFSLGVGAYHVKYDTFANYKNGPLTGTHRKTYIGLDQAAVTFSYSFGIR